LRRLGAERRRKRTRIEEMNLVICCNLLFRSNF
jgi:hypothetical protein